MPPTKRDVEVLDKCPCGNYVKARIGKDVCWLTPAEVKRKQAGAANGGKGKDADGGREREADAGGDQEPETDDEEEESLFDLK